MEIGIIALIVFVSLFAIWLIFYFIPVGLWFSALVSPRCDFLGHNGTLLFLVF